MTLPKMTKKRYVYIGITVILVFLFFHYWDNIAGFIGSAYQAFVPLIAGAIIAYILNILMSFYERHYFTKKNPPFAQKTRTAVCLIAAILTVLAVFSVIISLIVPQLINCIKLIIQKLPQSAERIVELVNNISWLPESVQETVQGYADKLLNIDWSAITAKVVDFLKSGLATNKASIGTVLSGTASAIVSVIVGIIFSVYFLACKKQILGYVNRITNVFCVTKRRQTFLRFVKTFNKVFHKYIVAECVEAAILGILCLICMSILCLPYAPMISAMVMLMALIPLVGSTISAVVGTLMILSVSPMKALIFFIMLMVIQVIEGNVIYPKVVGKGVGTPGIIVLGAVTVGGSIFGIIGMLIGVPVATTLWNEFKKELVKKEKKVAVTAGAGGEAAGAEEGAPEQAPPENAAAASEEAPPEEKEAESEETE
ncbi:MAG: AI-2E family transporter [Clostridia bacterium]|nr:AI-2E family transporter [Clostridia bacterium]